MLIEFAVGGAVFKISEDWAPRVIALLQALEAVQSVPLDFKVELTITSVGPKVIAVIKEVRALTGKGLKESKEMVLDNGRDKNMPISLGRYPYERVRQIIDTFADAGATVTMPHPLMLLGEQALGADGPC